VASELEAPSLATDGTLEGLLTAIYAAFEQDLHPPNIQLVEQQQSSLFDSVIPVITNIEQAEKMKARIIEAAGKRCYDNVKALYLSDDPTRGGTAFRYTDYALRTGEWSLNHLAHPVVAEAESIIRKVYLEARYMIQFVRFADIGSGLYYAHISPQASVVPLIMSHFAKRYNVQPFIIHDSIHGLSGVFNTRRWWMVEGVPEGISLASEADDCYQQLWQRFYKTIAIPERKNPTVQRNFMPKRFWGDMCEQRLSYIRRGDTPLDRLANQ